MVCLVSRLCLSNTIKVYFMPNLQRLFACALVIATTILVETPTNRYKTQNYGL